LEGNNDLGVHGLSVCSRGEKALVCNEEFHRISLSYLIQAQVSA
jgi:hypothetical protein